MHLFYVHQAPHSYVSPQKGLFGVNTLKTEDLITSNDGQNAPLSECTVAMSQPLSRNAPTAWSECPTDDQAWGDSNM